MNERMERMQQRLEAALDVKSIDITDQSHLHVGHAGARDGLGHYDLDICASEFSSLNAVKRHQLIYQALGDMMQTDIHALSIHATAPNEAS